MKIKNILIVDEGTGFGGSLIVAARLAAALDKTQFNPIIVTAMDINIARDHVNSAIELIGLSKNFTYVDRAKITPKLLKIKPRIIFKTAIALLTLYEVLINIRYPITLAKLVYSKKIDLIHVNNSKDALIVARLTRTKCIQHLHGWENPPDSRSAQFYYKLPDAFISISNLVRDIVVKAGADSKKITVLHNPIADTPPLPAADIEALKNKLNINNQLTTIAIFGRVIRWKGQYQFVQALKSLKDKGYQFNALIVGDDGEGFNKSYFNKVKHYTEAHLADHNVIFTGYVSQPEKLYQVSDIVVHASIEPEPFGLVITEAMQHGCAVIASSHGAGKEIINDNLTGLIADPLNTKQLTDKVRLLLDDPKLKDSVRNYGMQHVKNTMSLSTFASQVEAIYNATLPS
ncbi:MAG: glycosyltransferase family 4 protein [Oceanicoccus sp.]|uniref:glycosyltransferase family 4 protein n=1 Tax=Oceanicoccus sp. TaxID=2691044 RepID=UPI00261FD147|nr:glycosyltransferase family 4 protein [Oceanicoccus sp.]MDG1772709.1 glycosyltransferase family 4 protein [Oceanicoccus sp.]